MHQPIARCRQLGTHGYGRFAHDQGGEHGGQHHHREHDVGASPGLVQVAEAGGAEPLGEEQGTGRGEQGSHPVAGHVAGCERGLALVVSDFQAVGVDSDVLGGRGEGDQHGQGNQPGQVFLRITKAHADESHYHQNLRQHQPGAASTELAEQRQAPLVEQWRPDPFKGIGQADQAGITDGLAGHPGLTQPHRQGRKHQHVGQAGGKAKQQQHQGRRAGIGSERSAPGFTGHGPTSASSLRKQSAHSNRCAPSGASHGATYPHDYCAG
ncbi:hypothetical protein D3C75_806030 [compost metagenome]